MSERQSVIAVSCFEIARRDANVAYIFFFGWLLAVLVATSALYTMLSVRHFLASGQLAGFWQLHIGVSFFVGVGITIGIADCITFRYSR
jgi:hypothetical protein